MFTQSGWDNKRVNRSASVLTPIPCIGSNSVASVGKHLTSTPMSSIIYRGADLTSNTTRVRPNRIKQPERYSLSDTSYNNSPLNSSSPTDRQNSSTSIPNAAGPLLASSRYNIGMGTYTDMHSPGFASRIVQYSGEYGESEHGRERLTHLPKYGSPGLFPIVNLNKTPLKSIKPNGNRSVTVRIAPPDNSYNMDRSLILNQSLQSPTQTINNTSQSEISTRSVLDALKEISRKRLHARDDSIEKNKRQRKSSHSLGTNVESIDTPVSSKRVRDIDVHHETSFNGTNGSSPSPKKYKQKHGYNDIISSLSSSIHLRQQYANKRKAEMQQPKETDINKQMKLGNTATSPIKPPETIYNASENSLTVEENTVSSPSKSQINSKDNTTENINDKSSSDKELNDKRVENFNEGTIVNENGVCRLTFISNPPEKQNDIFVPFKPPTEESKRKRLAALLGALSGEDWDVKTLTKKFFPSENEDKVDTGNLGGILQSPGKAKPDSAKKHVTFNLPTLPTDNNSIGSVAPVASLPTENAFAIMKKSEITTTSNSITQPISSSSSFGANNISTPPKPDNQLNSLVNPLVSTENKISFGNVQQSSPQVVSTSSAVVSTPIKFGTAESSTPLNFNTPIASSAPSTPTLRFGETKSTPQSTISFGKPADPPQTTLSFGSNSTQSETSSKPTGGFHFDLNKKPESSAPTAVGTPNSNTSKTATPKFSFGGTNSSDKKDENKSTFASPFGTAAFSAKTTAASTSAVATPSFSFENTATKENVPQTTSAFATPTISFGTQNSAFGTPKTTSNAAAPFGSSNVSFGTPTTSNPPAFGTPTSSNPPALGTPITSNPSAFGTPTATSNPPAFGSSTTGNPPAFGTPSTGNAVGFGTPTTSNPPVFGTPATTNPPSFGTPTTSNPPAFGTLSKSSNPPAFGTPTTNNPPAFGTASNNNSFAFGTPTTNTSAFGTAPPSTTAPTFGTPATTAANMPFGTAAAPSFGGVTSPSNNAPSFGIQTATNPLGFGTSNTSSFGKSTNSLSFGQTSAPFGGTTTTPTFGSTTTPAFGSTPSGFGVTTTTNSSFGTAASFGTTSTAASPFGSSAPQFGTTTTNSNTFGTTSTTFGTPTTNTQFGAAASPFGTVATSSAPSAFGAQTTQSSGFGTQSSTITSGFPASPIFGATTQQSTAFGTNSASTGNTPNIFGSNNNTTNAFGATTNSSTFGTNNTTPNKPFGTSTFAFGSPATTQNNNTFGSSGFGGASSNVFGGSANSKPAFGATSPPAFGAQNTNGNMFGSTTQASNPPTTNASSVFGSTNQTPAFGTPSTFGNNNNNTSGTTAGGVFAFGGSQPAATTTNNAFQFGAPKPAATGGFNFSATSSTTPSTFNANPATPAFGANQFSGAPAPNMFSIGTGSTAPRPRATSTRYRKK